MREHTTSPTVLLAFEFRTLDCFKLTDFNPKANNHFGVWQIHLLPSSLFVCELVCAITFTYEIGLLHAHAFFSRSKLISIWFQFFLHPFCQWSYLIFGLFFKWCWVEMKLVSENVSRFFRLLHSKCDMFHRHSNIIMEFKCLCCFNSYCISVEKK